MPKNSWRIAGRGLTLEQWRENLDALAHPWDPADEAVLDALVAPGHPSTPGYSDPCYPLRGRPV